MSGRGARERRRLHREAMQLAVRERLTLDEATERVASYRAHLPRLEAAATPAIALAAPDAGAAEERPQMWWQRD